MKHPVQTTTRGRRIGRAGRWVVIAVSTVFLAFPFYWMAITAFKQTADLYDVRNDPFVFNMRPALEHVRLLLEQTLYSLPIALVYDLFLDRFISGFTVGAVK